MRFILWGAMHGAALAAHKGWQRIFPSKTMNKKFLPSLFGTLLTFHFVSFTWIFFRSASMTDAYNMITHIFTATPIRLIGEMLAGYRFIFAVMATGFLMHWCPSQWKEHMRGWYVLLHPAWKAVLAVLLFFLVFQMKSATIQPFIYFQF